MGNALRRAFVMMKRVGIGKESVRPAIHRQPCEAAEAMFVFSSVIIVATWFLARLLWDHVLRPTWHGDPRRSRVRFACITSTGVLIAATGFGAVIGSIYGWAPGVAAGAVLVPVYCFMAVVLRMLLQAFSEE
jgi:hypothetical protein